MEFKLKHSYIFKNLNNIYIVINDDNILKFEFLCDENCNTEINLPLDIVGFYNVLPNFYLKYNFNINFNIYLDCSFITTNRIWNNLLSNTNFIFTRIWYCSNLYFIITTQSKLENTISNSQLILAKCFNNKTIVPKNIVINHFYDFLITIF